MTKLALIPPRGMEFDTLRNRVHLALAQNNWRSYILAYQEAADRGDLVIVDNGAAEGATVSDASLLIAATVFCAKEIVVPDVLRDLEATKTRLAAFFNMARARVGVGQHFMGVAQGVTESEVLDCMDAFTKYKQIKTLGIPRHLLTTLHNPMARINLLPKIQEHFGGRFQVHFLGTDRRYLKEVYYVGRYHSWVRSIDTSAPYVYAAKDIILPSDPREPVQYMDRHMKYFDKEHEYTDAIVQRNVEVLNAWIRGEHYV